MIMSRVCSRLLVREPFYGSLLMNLKAVADSSVETAMVNNVELRYNPEYMASLPPDQQETLVAHEVMHPALGHIFRRGTRDLENWNIACDYSLNPLLVEAGFSPIPGWLCDIQYAGMSAEQIYSKRAQQEKEEKDGQQGSATGEEVEKGQPGSQGSQSGQGGTSGQAGEENASSGSLGADSGQSMGPGQVVPGCPTGGFTDAVPSAGQGNEEGLTQQDWEIAVQQAVKVAAAAGMMPGGMTAAIEDSVQPVVDWVAELRDFIVHNVASDQSWCNPNRRFAGQGLYLPGTVKENTGEIVLAIDTSGSTLSIQDVFKAEFGQLLAEVRPEKVTVIYCDYSVQSVEELAADDFDIAAYRPKGFGGTRFQPVFDYVTENNVNPLAVVYLTDLMGDQPVFDGCPVLWVAPDYCERYGVPGGVGRVLGIPCEK